MSHQSNSSLKSRKLYLNQTWVKQKGAALIFIAFILGLGAAVYVLKAYNADAARARQDEKTNKALNDAKVALIAWAVNYSSSPGQMPWPDRNSDGNYDGSSDCYIGAFDYGYLLGQLPSQPTTSPCLDPNNGLNIYSGLSTYPGLNQVFTDAQGNRLWYAVSRNLVYDYEHSENPIINPGMINPPHAITPYMRQGGTQSYPWLTVLDRSGSLVSDRVAAIIIAPGSTLENQNRSSSAPDAGEFLDAFMIGSANYKNSDSSLVNEDFIIGEDNRNVPGTDTTFIRPYYFNDKLVYITIDELMDAVARRASSEASSLVNKYKLKFTHFPYAAPLGSALDNFISSGTSTKGMVPIDVTDSCGCSSASNCSCSFDLIGSVAFKRGSGASWTSNTGSCSRSGAVCTCTGAGSCTRTTRSFICDISGTCTHTVTGVTNSYTYSSGANLNLFSASAGCSINSSKQVVCNGNGTFTMGLKEPSWFKTNLWQDYFYYEWSPTLSLQVGARTGVGALLIGVGDVITNAPYATKGLPQNRLPTNPTRGINDYLDSLENTNGDLIFDSTNKQKSNNFNDQAYIVAP